MPNRPIAIRVVAAFLFFASAMALFVGFALLFPGRLLEWLAQFNPEGMEAFHAIGRFSGVFLLALAVGCSAAGRGLLQRKGWAWWFAVCLFVVDGCGDLVSVFLIRDWWRGLVGAAVSCTFLYLLMRAGPRRREAAASRN